MHLREHWAGDLTARQLQVYVDYLPAESATHTAIRNAMTPEELAEMRDRPPTGHGRWSDTNMLLARIVDELAALRWMQSDGKGEKPTPIRRPGLIDRVMDSRLIEWLEYVRANHGGAPGG